MVTAIGNRRFFDACFAEEVEKARRVGDCFCLALADIDRFKHVNDRFGHLVGDRLLRLFANILVQNVRGQDKVARFGGEEFALMFPGARLVDAVSAVERIRGILEAKQWTVEPSGERVGKVTASFGVARLSADESATDLLRRVDQLLYEAKGSGKELRRDRRRKRRRAIVETAFSLRSAGGDGLSRLSGSRDDVRSPETLSFSAPSTKRGGKIGR